MGQRTGPEGLITTIFLQPVAGGEAEDVLPGEQATSGIKSVGEIHRWLDGTTLAYDALLGTGNRRLYSVDVTQHQRRPGPDRLAKHFTWDATGGRVAGQDYGYRASFWLWDLKARAYLNSTTPLPGPDQFFEAWSSDGRQALLSAWVGGLTYWQRDAKLKGLFRLGVETGHVEKLAEGAGLASWAQDRIAYLRFGKELTLVVARASDGGILWTDDLGSVTNLEEFRFWAQSYRPVFVGRYLVYRTSAGEWRISLADRKHVRRLFVGREAILSWSPDGRYVAVLDGAPQARLRVLENPLWGL